MSLASVLARVFSAIGVSTGTSRFLREDGAWTQPRLGKIAVYSTAGTFSWTCPAGVTSAKVTVTGGGNDGGASGTTGTGAGGGAGGTSIKQFNDLVPGTAYSLTVGARAAASSFTGPSATPTGNGGSVGGSANASSGGAGGTATGGDINLAGEGGASGLYSSGIGAISGKGGSSFWGGGGRGVSIISGQIAGVAGGAPGAGGSGAAAVSGTNQSGGAGQPGIVVIEY